MYLSRAAHAYERATRASDPHARKLYEVMHQRWMDEAVSLAIHKNVDLFELSKKLARLPPSDVCSHCRRQMELIAVEPTEDGRTCKFRCLKCQTERSRLSKTAKIANSAARKLSPDGTPQCNEMPCLPKLAAR